MCDCVFEFLVMSYICYSNIENNTYKNTLLLVLSFPVHFKTMIADFDQGVFSAVVAVAFVLSFCFRFVVLLYKRSEHDP